MKHAPMMDPLNEHNKVHFTLPQMRSIVMQANIEVAEINRGGGKTERITAPRIMHNSFAMPRSLGGLVTVSFKKLLTEIIPSLYTGFDVLQYEEDRDYVIGKGAPGTNWEKPYKRVRDWTHTMRVRNGSATVFISQDRETMGPGLSLDALYIEEARLVNGQRIMNSLRQALRGNLQYFGGMSEHHSMLIVSDCPTNKTGRWFRKFKEQAGTPENRETLSLIVQFFAKRSRLEQTVKADRLAPTTVVRYEQQIAKITETINELRRHAIHYHTASAFDNMAILGWDNFLQMERDMEERAFDRSMLGLDHDDMEGAWYSDFAMEKHCYTPGITSYTEARGYDRDRLATKDCRHDAEIHEDLPLEIAMDYGGRFNCMAVGQKYHDLLRVDKGFHAVGSGSTVDVLKAFCQYYRYHKHKHVRYYHDHTVFDRHGASPYTYYQITIDQLKEAGWSVEVVNIGHTPEPSRRKELFHKLLRDPQPKVLWNPDNCSEMISSMENTRIDTKSTSLVKRKNLEKSGSDEEQVSAPHYSDAVDTLVWGCLHTLKRNSIVPLTSYFS